MNNELIAIQKMLIKQMQRLDQAKDLTDMEEQVVKSNAMSKAAATFIKSVNVGIRVIELSEKYSIRKEKLAKELGI